MDMLFFWPTFAIFMLGLVLIGIGFSWRDKPAGIALLWMGTLCMLALVFYHVSNAVAL